MRPPDVNATPLLLGETGLFGIRTSPTDQASSLGLILLNAGMLPSVGPFRMNVELADAMSRLGTTALRLDQSGKGESPVRPELTPADAALLDYDEAFANLRRCGVEGTIIAGLCSGAVDALQIAAARESVVGLVLLDGYVEQTLRWHFHHRANRAALQTRRIFSRLSNAISMGPRGAIERMKRKLEADSVETEAPILTDYRDWETLDLRSSYAQVLDRGVKILSIFSGTFPPYNHHGQMASFLGSDTDTHNLTEVFLQQADHTYTNTLCRRHLLETVCGWFSREFPE
jgi:hypothetical protein